MFDLLLAFSGTQILAVMAIAGMEVILPPTEPRPHRGAMALGMVMVAVVAGLLGVLMRLAGEPMLLAVVGIPAALVVLVAVTRVPLMTTAAAQRRTTVAGLAAVAIMAAVVTLTAA